VSLINREEKMNKTAYVLVLILLFSCTHNRSAPARETTTDNDREQPLTQQEYPRLNMPEQNGEAESDSEWIVIGGQKVRNRNRPREYDYYLKSETEEITSVSLYINPDDEKRAAGLGGIEQLENLKELRICLYGEGMDTMDYSSLNALQNLEQLDFECPGDYKLEKIPDLSGLTSRHNIAKIGFDQCALTSVDNIELLPNLRSVLIYNNYAGLSDLKSLNRLSQLERLSIHSIKKENVLPWAKSLMYSLDEKNTFQIEEFSSLTKLKRLSLYGGEIDAKGIEQLRSLEDVIFGYPIIIKNQRYISGARGIKKLEIMINDREPNIQFLGRNMASLEVLKLYAAAPTWGGATEEPYQILDVVPIGDIPHLKHLELWGFVPRNLEGLDKLKNMEGSIFVIDCVVTGESGTTKWRLLDAPGDR
jgi:hypothetical protein